jgi:hypothetical protein
MTMKILQTIFRRVQVNDAEGRVLQAILGKANHYGKHAKVAYECIAAITGFSIRHVIRLVKSLIFKRRLLRVDKQVLWPGHNAINVYHVIIPWRGEVGFAELGIGRTPARQDRLNNKSDKRCHPNSKTNIKTSSTGERLFTTLPTKEKVSAWLTPGSAPWYFAQGLVPPLPEGEKESGK